MKEENINNFYFKTFIIIMASTLIALLGLHFFQLILILFPVLFIANSIKDGWTEGITNLIVTLIIISLVETINIGMIFAIVFIPFTFVISMLIKKRKSNKEILGFSSITFFVSILVIFIVIKILGVDVVKYIEDIFRQVVDSQLEAIENLGLSKYEFLNTKEMLEDAYKNLLLIIPSMILMLSFFISYINYLLSGILLERLGICIFNIPKLAKFKLPNDIVIGVVSMFILTFLAGKVGFVYYETVIVNIFVLISMALLMQGLAVFDYLLNKLKFKPILKTLIYITFIFNPSLIYILTIVGLTDLIFDLRKPRKKKS